MTKQVSKDEVEDVLNSIRRLISEKKRDAEGTTRELFVLSDDYRVSTAPTRSEPGVLKLTAENVVGEERTVSLDLAEDDLDAVISELLGSDDDLPHLTNPDEVSDRPLLLSDDLKVVKRPINDGEEAEATEGSTEAEDVVFAPLTGADEHDDTSEEEGKPAAADAGFDEVLKSRVASLERMIARAPGQWEPDGSQQSDYAGTIAPSMDWQENLELDATGRPVRSLDTHDTLGQVGSSLPSEDALREMIAEAVRAELQGKLGGEISRSVADVVREEVSRALKAPRD